MSDFALINEALSWSNHVALCDFTYDSNLASIHSGDANTEAMALCGGSDCWIGLFDNTSLNQFVWLDDTNWDFGTNISAYPWLEASSSDSNLCVESTNAGWDDVNCDSTQNNALCSSPSHTYVVQDNANYPRVPTSSNLIGEMDILDEMYIEFDMTVNSFPTSSMEPIIYIGSTSTNRFPAIYVDSSNLFHIKFSTVANSSYSYSDSTPLVLDTPYHFELLVTQSQLLLSFNSSSDTINVTKTMNSHTIMTDQDIYIGGRSGSSYDPADVVLSGLVVGTSNAHNDYNSGWFNYLCDYNNRFTEDTGDWVYNEADCEVRQIDEYMGNAMVWMGVEDTDSLGWTDYKIEAVINFNNLSQDFAEIIFRIQDIGNNQYSVTLHFNHQAIKFGKKLTTSYEQLHYVSATIAYDIDYTLRVEVSGNTVNVYLDNVWLFEDTDNEFADGSIGFNTDNAYVTFKSLRISFDTDSYLISNDPTATPTNAPSDSTIVPTTAPTIAPTTPPTNFPTNFPTQLPIVEPTQSPTGAPTLSPVGLPTQLPTVFPTEVPSAAPTQIPYEAPTQAPSAAPTQIPSVIPTQIPSSAPIQIPSFLPTNMPTTTPTGSPTRFPTFVPTQAPTQKPTKSDTGFVSTSTELTIISSTSSGAEGEHKQSSTSSGDEGKYESGGNIVNKQMELVIILLSIFCGILLICVLFFFVYFAKHKKKMNIASNNSIQLETVNVETNANGGQDGPNDTTEEQNDIETPGDLLLENNNKSYIVAELDVDNGENEGTSSSDSEALFDPGESLYGSPTAGSDVTPNPTFFNSTADTKL